MKRSFAKCTAAVAVGLMVASFLSSRWATHSYASTHPRSAEAGFVHALCEGQVCFFINDVESTGLVLLQLTGIFALVAAIALLVAGGVRFVLRGRWVAVSEYADAGKRQHTTFTAVAGCSLAIFVLVFYMRGAAISAFLVSLGIVLDV